MNKFEENIKNEAPLLFSLKKENSLKVPKGYFEQLPEQLMNITTQESKPKIINLKNWFIYSTTIAALLVLGFFALQNYNQPNNEVLNFNISFNKLTAESFENEFITGNLDTDFDESELYEISKQLEIANTDFENFFE